MNLEARSTSESYCLMHRALSKSIPNVPSLVSDRGSSSSVSVWQRNSCTHTPEGRQWYIRLLDKIVFDKTVVDKTVLDKTIKSQNQCLCKHATELLVLVLLRYGSVEKEK